MLLGTAIARLQDEAQVEETLAALDDWVLMARMRSAADAAGLSLSDFASAAVGSFLAGAGDEDWLALMTAANGAADPATACLKVMLEFGVSRGSLIEPLVSSTRNRTVHFAVAYLSSQTCSKRQLL